MSQTIRVPTAYHATDFASGATPLWVRVDSDEEVLARCMRLLRAGMSEEANNLYNRHFPPKR